MAFNDLTMGLIATLLSWYEDVCHTNSCNDMPMVLFTNWPKPRRKELLCKINAYELLINSEQDPWETLESIPDTLLIQYVTWCISNGKDIL